MASDYVLGDIWANAWRFFLAKRAADAALIGIIFWFTATQYDKLSESFWPLMGFALAASAIVWLRDVLAYFVLHLVSGDDRRVPRSMLAALRESEIDPSRVMPARLDGLKNLVDDETAPTNQRIQAAIIHSSIEGAARILPWYRRAHSRDLMDNVVLRFTLEARRAAGLARDDETEDRYYSS